ncbi:MAG: RNA polymerase sigma factor [Phycisphaerales bacterium]
MDPAAGARAARASGAERLDREQFAREFAACSRALWSIAAAVVGQKSRADDIVQEAALAAFQKIEDFEPGTSFLAWMGKFVRYTALNEVRRRKMRAAAPLDGVDVPAGAEACVATGASTVSRAGELVDDQRGFDDDVAGALGELDEVARACLLLRSVHDMPYKDISLLMDIPEGTAMSHVHRARKSMRDRLAPQFDAGSGRRTA